MMRYAVLLIMALALGPMMQAYAGTGNGGGQVGNQPGKELGYKEGRDPATINAIKIGKNSGDPSIRAKALNALDFILDEIEDEQIQRGRGL